MEETTLSSPEATKKFIDDHYPHASPSISNIAPLSGGFVNYVYRVTFSEQLHLNSSDEKYDSVIVKHAPPFFAGMGPNIPFSQDRLEFEVQALRKLPIEFPVAFDNPKIGVPKVVDAFISDHTFIMQDVGSLESLFSAPQYLTTQCAEVLASFISKLHESTKSGKQYHQYKNIAATKSVYEFVYAPLASVLKENEIVNWQELSTKADDVWKELYDVDGQNVSILMGDFWPASVLVQPNASGLEKLWIIDWEFVNLGNPILDISYFFTVIWGQAMMLEEHRHHIKSFMKAFVSTYTHLNLRKLMAERLFSVHFAVSLINEAINTRWCKCTPKTLMHACPCARILFDQGLAILQSPSSLIELIGLNE